jgi:hypothetical protein
MVADILAEAIALVEGAKGCVANHCVIGHKHKQYALARGGDVCRLARSPVSSTFRRAGHRIGA